MLTDLNDAQTDSASIRLGSVYDVYVWFKMWYKSKIIYCLWTKGHNNLYIPSKKN